MPLMEVVLNQEYAGQQCINRWNYMSEGTPAAVTHSFALLSALGFIPTATTLLAGSLGGVLQTLQNSGVTFVQALCRAVYIDDDFFDNPFFAGTVGAAGAAAGRLSPIDAWGFRSSRVKQSIGRGYKRFVGVDDEMISNGGLIGGAAVAQCAAVATEMGVVQTFDDSGNTLSYSPCIVQKEKYTTPSGKFAYRYYPSEVLQEPHTATGITWSFYPQTRSQTSRQYGRGS